ncbi:hypothetical protein H696_06108 [Fonticula alba]|uniref:Uncharacterized protein n=1 Tax=Fonticula alba TaxID=691883 RepID=A0A058YZR9_FONAL|nr:hypothetical protein H696_06108 [Fonticula alba]KCV67469.1 hypothetical protein H696_06108 [Fonticula alba]|eukprot:XP_009498145.1 hypothetical protein H696_06108 [Fonticula alba]
MALAIARAAEGWAAAGMMATPLAVLSCPAVAPPAGGCGPGGQVAGHDPGMLAPMSGWRAEAATSAALWRLAARCGRWPVAGPPCDRPGILSVSMGPLGRRPAVLALPPAGPGTLAHGSM